MVLEIRTTKKNKSAKKMSVHFSGVDSEFRTANSILI